MTWVHDDGTARMAKLAGLGDYDNNAYVVACARTGEAVIVDAAAQAEVILAAVTGLDVQAVLTTHGHHDHIQALDAVTSSLSIPWRLHLADVDIAGRRPDEPLSDGDEIIVGDVALHVLHTPGHTPGSVSFVLEPVVFTGDTLFPGGPGATRWDYSSFGQIMDSVEQRLMRYPDPTVVHPGHGASTTLGNERPHLEEWRARGW